MPTVETGFFVLILAMAFGFTLIGFINKQQNIKGLFHIVGVALFMVLTVWGASGYEVSTTTTVQSQIDVGGTLTPVLTNSTQIFIAGGEDTGWIGYAFLGLAALNLVVFVKDVWKAE